MIFERFPHFQPQDFVFKVAQNRADLDDFFALRRKIFCNEQMVFDSDDRDRIDEDMIPIVCKSIIAGMEDDLVGVVRIHQSEPGRWHGSRLGVAEAYRRVRRISPAVSVRNHQPCRSGLGAIGASLIYKAVSTANELGCYEFLATVQHQNARFFERLHWDPIEEVELFGLKHVRMRADLNYYRPAQVA